MRYMTYQSRLFSHYTNHLFHNSYNYEYLFRFLKKINYREPINMLKFNWIL